MPRQNGRLTGTNSDQARHQTQPSARSATPATPNESGCPQVPHLSRKVPRRHGRLTATISAPPDPAQRHKRHTCHAKQKLDAPKRHACHVKRRWMSPRATPATQSAAASLKRATSPVPQVARVPRKTKVDVSMCHACHVKRRWMSPSGKPTTESRATNSDQARHQTHPSARSATSAASATPATPNCGRCRQAPRLPCETKMNVFKRHACHAKRRWM